MQVIIKDVIQDPISNKRINKKKAHNNERCDKYVMKAANTNKRCNKYVIKYVNNNQRFNNTCN